MVDVMHPYELMIDRLKKATGSTASAMAEVGRYVQDHIAKHELGSDQPYDVTSEVKSDATKP